MTTTGSNVNFSAKSFLSLNAIKMWAQCSKTVLQPKMHVFPHNIRQTATSLYVSLFRHQICHPLNSCQITSATAPPSHQQINNTGDWNMPWSKGGMRCRGTLFRDSSLQLGDHAQLV